MRLQGGAGSEVCGLSRGDLRGTGIACGSGGLVSEGQCCAVYQGPGQLQCDVHIGQLVLHGLVRADRTAELRTLFGVRYGTVQQGLSGPDQLRRNGKHTKVDGATGVE